MYEICDPFAVHLNVVSTEVQALVRLIYLVYSYTIGWPYFSNSLVEAKNQELLL